MYIKQSSPLVRTNNPDLMGNVYSLKHVTFSIFLFQNIVN